MNSNLYRNSRLLPFLAVLGISLTAQPATAQIVSSPNTAGWKAVLEGGSVLTDPLNDAQTGVNEGELVGNSTNPVFQMFFDRGSLASLTDGTVYFRIRLGGDQSNNGFDGLTFAHIDVNGDSSADLTVGVTGHSGTKIGIFDPGPGPNSGPSSTTVSEITTLGGVAYTYAAPTTTNYSWARVYSSALDLDPGDNDNIENLDGGAGEPDYYLSFAIPFQQIVTFATVDKGIAGVNENTPFGYVLTTGRQPNTINQDVSPDLINGNFNFTDPTPTSYFAIPEPGTFAFLGLGVFGFALGLRRRK